MKINVRHIAKLSRLNISNDNLDSFTEEMNAIVKMMENLPKIEQMETILDSTDMMQLRKDEVQPSYPREDILRNAPQTVDGCFLVPKTVE